MAQIDFVFEDLPLLATDDGYESAFVNGLASIDYGRDGQWRVTALGLDVGRVVLVESGARKQVAKRITPEGWVAQKIELTLLTDPDWQRRIVDAIEADQRIQDADRAESPSFLKRFARLLEV